MRRARITYTGAYHHVMNRGIRGENILPDSRAKTYFLEAIEDKMRLLKIRILAYCLMNNHYHLILQNSSGKLSEFMKHLNGQYGVYYRKRKGGLGYVFQSRFKSTLIQEDKYLKMVILYVFLNPVRRGIVEFPWRYRWSSINEYYTKTDSRLVDNIFVEDLFETRKNLRQQLLEWTLTELPIKHTRMGDILGDDSFIAKAEKKFNRRKTRGRSLRMRRDDFQFESAKKIVKEFLSKMKIELKDIDVTTRQGKAMRSSLLILLKDEAGLTYSQIIRYPLFQSVKYTSLGHLYRRAKEKKKEDCT